MNFVPRLKKIDWLIILGLVVAYLATRLYQLTALPIFVDEAIYSRWAQIALHDASWRFISLTDGKQPLFMWIAMLPLKLFADPLFATRLVSVVSGLFTLLGLWYSGYLLFGKKLAHIVGYLSLITPFLFFYERFAVVESMLTASGVWLLNLGIILIMTLRLDVALILGLFGGLALLVKSPALIYLLLIPITYPFLTPNKLISKKTLKFISLFAVALLLSAVIYNIQRLSPWMHMISAKNGDFIISPLKMITERPYRIWQNFADSQLWVWSYLTIPLYLTSIVGGLLLLKHDWRKFMITSAWFWGPLMATVMSALLFRPRYIAFATPFVLLYAAYGLSKLAQKYLIPSLTLLAILPLTFYYHAYTSPLTMKLPRADWDYQSGWAAGNGVKEITEWLIARSHEVKGDVEVFTEGTFGLLPHGIELYAYGRSSNLRITGIYPLDSVPPSKVKNSVATNPETFFILNNTQVKDIPVGLKVILSYPKADGSLITLYQAIP
jgi:4-amino-4-deoxy-L-arabinose transferase-like glycosyltransferase